MSEEIEESGGLTSDDRLRCQGDIGFKVLDTLLEGARMPSRRIWGVELGETIRFNSIQDSSMNK